VDRRLRKLTRTFDYTPPDHLLSPQRGLQIAHGAVLNVFSESLIYEVAGIGSVHCPHVVRDLLERNGSLPLFILNGDASNAHEVDVLCEDFSPARSTALTGNLITAWNKHSELH